jgi:hypothetical protein
MGHGEAKLQQKGRRPKPTPGTPDPVAVTISSLGGFWRDVSKKAWKFYKSGSPLSGLAIKAVNEF